MTPFTIRMARLADLSALDGIALEAKAHWGYSAAQLAAWRDDLLTPADSLASRPVFVAEIEDTVVGFTQVATDVAPWEVWALWVKPACMRRGIGKALLGRARSFAAAAGQRQLAIDSDPNASELYLRCRATPVGVVPAPIPGAPGRVRPQFLLDTGAAGIADQPEAAPMLSTQYRL